jgi:hypothetical protein
MYAQLGLIAEAISIPYGLWVQRWRRNILRQIFDLLRQARRRQPRSTRLRPACLAA